MSEIPWHSYGTFWFICAFHLHKSAKKQNGTIIVFYSFSLALYHGTIMVFWTCTFMDLHLCILADTFIQSVLHCIQDKHLHVISSLLAG